VFLRDVRQWFGLRGARVALAVLVSSAVAGPSFAQGRGEKLDTNLRERARRAGPAGDNELEDVIVTMRSSDSGRRSSTLRAHGARKNRDLKSVNGSATRLTRRQLRELAADPDVVSISTDAEVRADGVGVDVIGAAGNQPYSLRATLGLETVGTTTRTFQPGVQGYASAVTAGLVSTTPTTAVSGASLKIQLSPAGNKGMLVRFDNLFGTGSGQVPLGAKITRAELRFRHANDGASTATASLYPMLVSWASGATWNSMSMSGAGIQFNNIEAKSTPDASVTGLLSGSFASFVNPALTATVQSWANGSPNRGWVLWQNNANDWTVYSTQHSATSSRPQLIVTYESVVQSTSLTGLGVTVAVVDSGLFQDGGSSTRLRTTRDFVGGQSGSSELQPRDEYGHGTHVAGLIGGDKAEVMGVAPGADFVSLRVLDRYGVGRTSDVIKALEWAVDKRAEYGIDIINLSLGHPIYEPAATDPLVQAVEAAVRAGIVVVASAGNAGRNVTGNVGYAGISSPGNAPSAITVGSVRTLDTTTRTDDLVADYSSRGPTWYDAFAKPDVVAPGHRLLSAATDAQELYARYPTLRDSKGGRPYLRLSGTSMAAGVVSGTVALMMQNSSWYFSGYPTPNAIKAMLQHSAFPMTDATGAAYDVLTQGAGALNTMGAITLAGSLFSGVGVGENWVYYTFYPQSYIDGQWLAWGGHIIWGDKLLWSDAIYTNHAAYGANIVWGDSGDNIVWGDNDNIVWGDSLRDDNIVWGDNDNIVWGDNDNIVWGDSVPWQDNIVWGDSDDNIVWGDSLDGHEDEVWSAAVEVLTNETP
jgi:serine protease AprX